MLLGQLPSFIKYSELEGSPGVIADERGLSAVRRFLVSGKDGGATIFIMCVKGSLARRIAPETYPAYERLVCVSADARPFPKSKGDKDMYTPTGPVDPKRMYYEWWEITCRFEVPVTLEYTNSGEFLSIPVDGFVWADGTKIPNQIPIGKVCPMSELVVVRKGVPIYDHGSVTLALGTINNSIFDPITLENDWRERYGMTRILSIDTLPRSTHAVGTVLFTGGRVKQIADSVSDPAFDIEYTFQVLPDYRTWNQFFNPKAATAGAPPASTWQRIRFAPTGTPPRQQGFVDFYAQSNFNNFLRAR